MAQVNGKNNGHSVEFEDKVSIPSASGLISGRHSAVSSLTPDGNESRRLPEGLDDTAHLLSFASEGNVKLTKRVLQSGVDVNASDYDGRTALHLAASEGRIEVIKLLLSMGANVNPTDRWGSTESGHLSTPMLSPARSPGDDFEIDVSELDFQNAALVGKVSRSSKQLFSPQQLTWELKPEYKKTVLRRMKGAFGEIRLVNWRGTRVAVKTLHTQLSARPEVEREFRDELMLLKKLRHPNIVFFVICVGKIEFGNRGAIGPQGDLHEILQRKGPLCAEEAVHYALDVARGMSYLHQHKPKAIVHRDLKPRNLLRDEAGHLKVADFGLSRLLKAHNSEELQEAFELSDDKSSFLYVAPELLCKKSYDKSVDVYSFAMIVFEVRPRTVGGNLEPSVTYEHSGFRLITADTHCYLQKFEGFSPFYVEQEMFEGSPVINEEDPKDAADKSAQQNTQPNFTATTYPPGMKELITRCWDQDPRKRPQFLEIVGILEEMEAGLSEGRMEHKRSDEGRGSSGGRCRCIVL